MINVVFIGGLTNGKIVYDYLKDNKYVNLQFAITHSYIGQSRYIHFDPSPILIQDNYANNWVNTIKNLNPDIIIVAGWSELLSDELLSIPKLGTIGFHPAKLPFDRGRSVLAWQIEDGYTQTALTLFYYNNIPDGGDIIAQEVIKIDSSDYINDILDKIDFATENLIRAYFPLIRQNKAPRLPQDFNIGTFRRLRGVKDSQIDWNRPVNDIINKIRAISKPYPGAETILDESRYKIWRAKSAKSMRKYALDLAPGTVFARFYDGTFMVKARDGIIHVTNYEKIN